MRKTFKGGAVTSLLILAKIMFGQPRPEVGEDGHRSRHLRQHRQDGADNVEFIDVMRVKPKLSYSMSSTLDKLLEEERKAHNQLPGWPKPLDAVPIVHPGGGASNLNNIKASLKDPRFVQKIRQLEDKRQVRKNVHVGQFLSRQKLTGGFLF